MMQRVISPPAVDPGAALDFPRLLADLDPVPGVGTCEIEVARPCLVRATFYTEAAWAALPTRPDRYLPMPGCGYVAVEFAAPS
jgi:hypothetical protein